MVMPNPQEDELATQIITRYNQFRIMRQGTQEALDNCLPEVREMIRQYAAKARIDELHSFIANDRTIYESSVYQIEGPELAERIKQLKKGQV